MRIEGFQFEQGNKILEGQNVSGIVKVPQGAKIIHVGATPPNGEMILYCEVPEVETPKVTLDFAILQQKQNIPEGYEYLGYILAIPILFIYQRTSVTIETPS